MKSKSECLVASLGREWKRLNEIENSRTDFDSSGFATMQSIRMTASYLTPESDEGWSFQVMSATVYAGMFISSEYDGKDDEGDALERILAMLHDRHGAEQWLITDAAAA